MQDILYMAWSDQDNMGIAIIDEQHRGIVSIINSFRHFWKKGNGSEALMPTLNMLEQYTKLHFKTEEDMFEEVENLPPGHFAARGKACLNWKA